jgi:hypothetical protein
MNYMKLPSQHFEPRGPEEDHRHPARTDGYMAETQTRYVQMMVNVFGSLAGKTA